MKKLLLGLLLLAPATQAFERFEFDHLAAQIYLDVEPICNRMIVQRIYAEYIEWLHTHADNLETKEEAMYVSRLSLIMSELAITYHYGV